MVEMALETQELSRYYGEFCALAPTSLSIPEREIVVLSGPNGAGKSTLLQCLSGLLRPTRGSVRICGYDLYENEVEAKKQLAFVPDVPRFYTELTAWEHLKFIALAYYTDQGFEARGKAIMDELGLWEARDLYPHNYSRGMRLKLGLALAFIRPFQLLIMDEPTSALDPQAVDYLVHKLQNLREQGVAVLFTSHNLDLIKVLNARHWRMEKGVLELDA
jgi:ABC-2 type transport system ATP-binding protein